MLLGGDELDWWYSVVFGRILEQMELYIAFKLSHVGFWEARSAKGNAMAIRQHSPDRYLQTLENSLDPSASFSHTCVLEDY